MSGESYSSLDESSLRALLDGTMDLDERRLIRSAIRELRRREIQDMEAALATKRFRPTRVPPLEDKENHEENHRENLHQHKPESSDALELLSQKLQGIRDIEELTKMLRSAGEYEERKMIRATIRQIREEHQQSAVERCRALERLDGPSGVRTQASESTRGQSTATQHRPDAHATGTSSSMVLVFDPLLKDEGPQPLLIQTPREALHPGPDPLPSLRQRLDSASSDRSSTSSDRSSTSSDRGPTSSDHGSVHSCSNGDSVGSGFRTRLGSGASDRSQGPLQRSRLDSGDSDKNQGPLQCSHLDSGASDKSQGPLQRSRLDSGASDKSQGPVQRSRLNSGASDKSQGPVQRSRFDSGASDKSQGAIQGSHLDSGASDKSQRPLQCSRLDSGASEHSNGSLPSTKNGLDSNDLLNSGHRPRLGSGASEHSNSVCSDDKGPAEPAPVTNGSALCIDSLEGEGRAPTLKEQEQPDGAGFSRHGPKHGLNGSLRGRTDFLNQKITINNSLSNGKPKDAVLEHFTRTNSVQERLRKYTESTAQHSQRTHSSRSMAPVSYAGGQSQGSGGGMEGPAAAAEEKPRAEEEQAPGSAAGQQQQQSDADMKTFLTIEIKEGPPRSNAGAMSSMGAPCINANALGQRTELTLGLRATPFKISTFNSAPSIKMETEPIVASEPVFSAPPSMQAGRPAADLPNGSSATAKPEERPGKLTPETLAAIEDEEMLDKMLDESKDFEERRLIRAAMRDLRKRKREAMLGCTQEQMDQREKERESRLQELRTQRDQKTASRAGAGTGEVVIRKLEKSADGNMLSQVTKMDRFAQSDDGSRSSRSTVVETSYVQKTDRGTVQSKSYSYSSSSTSISSNTKKVGSVFDREDDNLSRGGGGGLAAVERRQAERRKELMRAQTMPKSSSMQARKAMIERLDKDASAGSEGPAVVKINRVQRATSFGVPNANTIKQMLLDWCRAKTRSYEHVDIQNFSSSWSNGMAFCALVHHFFPEAFDYSALNPSERRHNFDLAFSMAERMVDCPQLLDVDDMVKMREPDWKCVYTYLQEFYRGLVTKGLVKTRANSS
ncbi:uncharacterized protein smtnb isoform X2 [Eucyclogobius newberryi]|uniref:uncharacterized protein smtnb isoform X2 n=1 Tax=Eucyclogobius newberryi TaxID=166745 RepID=UPI003B5A4E61